MQKDLSIVIVDSAYHELAAKALDQAIEVTGADSVLYGLDHIEDPIFR